MWVFLLIPDAAARLQPLISRRAFADDQNRIQCHEPEMLFESNLFSIVEPCSWGSVLLSIIKQLMTSETDMRMRRAVQTASSVEYESSLNIYKILL